MLLICACLTEMSLKRQEGCRRVTCVARPKSGTVLLLLRGNIILLNITTSRVRIRQMSFQ